MPKAVKLTISDNLYKESSKAVQEFGYLNIQDLAVEGLRKLVIELKREQALRKLHQNFQSVSPKKVGSKKNKTLDKQYLESHGSEILREHGFDYFIKK